MTQGCGPFVSLIDLFNSGAKVSTERLSKQQKAVAKMLQFVCS